MAISWGYKDFFNMGLAVLGVLRKLIRSLPLDSRTEDGLPRVLIRFNVCR